MNAEEKKKLLEEFDDKLVDLFRLRVLPLDLENLDKKRLAVYLVSWEKEIYLLAKKHFEGVEDVDIDFLETYAAAYVRGILSGYNLYRKLVKKQFRLQ